MSWNWGKRKTTLERDSTKHLEFLSVHILKLCGPASDLLAHYKLQAPASFTYLVYWHVQNASKQKIEEK
jgi:hypothetical protein